MEARDQIAAHLSTIRDFIRWGMTQFQRAGLYYGHGTDNPLDEAVALVLHCLYLPYDQLDAVIDARLTPEERHLVLDALETRFVERVPVPYITGEAWFAGYPFTVDDRVLIPRSPLAELIEQGFEPWVGEQPVERVLDLCTGSGCIGIACALYLPEAEVVLADISQDALDVAEANIVRHGVQDRVEAVQSDLFSELQHEVFDIIVSNPPYVDALDMASLPPEYRHEPELALAAGDDGLDLVRTILREAADHLSEHGLLIVEVGNSWEALEEAYPLVPFTWIEFERGGHGVFLLTREQLDACADHF
ncbi:MAG: 50S ribosomal protein L3 N(5)-glutamine methyltransferase [Spongiibacteraceae bacterium]|jgi:ribosomal protein L3 glutamine methyltransferase|nr:50S ribosomal protein L3 N(5)-glutamine methyltransferase [Spongiibacteraceae bacterium]